MLIEKGPFEKGPIERGRARPVLALVAALGCLYASTGFLAPSFARADFPPKAGRLIQLAGPLQALPLPFVWAAWGEASLAQDQERAASYTRWLIELLPERKNLYVLFAGDLAFNLPAESTAEHKAQRLLDAFLMLKEGMRLNPDSHELPDYAAFMIRQKCRDEATRAAFEGMVGMEAMELGKELLLLAAAKRPANGASPIFSFQLQELVQMSMERRRRDHRRLAASLLRKAASHDRRLRARLIELAELVESKGTLEPNESLCNWLRNHPPFSRKPKVWGCR